MRAKAAFLSQVGIMGFTLALSFLASAQVAAQSPKGMTPELQKLREALDNAASTVAGRFPTGDHDLVIGQVVGGRLHADGPPAVHVRKNGLRY